MEKVNCNGPNAHKVYQWLRAHSLAMTENKIEGNRVHWNFGKFLIDPKNPTKVEYFRSKEVRLHQIAPAIDNLLYGNTWISKLLYGLMRFGDFI